MSTRIIRKKRSEFDALEFLAKQVIFVEKDHKGTFQQPATLDDGLEYLDAI
jgi:hypothetical protein